MINDFKTQLQKKLNEALISYGSNLTPVQQLQFPETTPSVNPADNQTVVTNGETTPINEPRTDINAEKQGGLINNEVLGEISSLLVSIGYILSKESIVPDKWNTMAVLDFLNTHFKQEEIPVDKTTPSESDVPVTDQPLLTYCNPDVNSIMESLKRIKK